MNLPLETLPGWPEAPEVSTSFMLMLLFIAPLVVGVIVAVLAFTPALGRRFRGELADDAPRSEEHSAIESGAAPSRAAIAPRARHAELDPDA